MKRAWAKWSERFIGAFKYVLAGYMMLAGALTTVAPGDPRVQGAMQAIYTSRISLVIIGLVIFLAGLILLIGKIKRSRKLVGRGLWAVYCCFVFATILNFLAYHDPSYWVGNLVMAIVVGALWLRWKFKTEYVNPKHFRDDVVHRERI
jgi:hypothetical protein